MIKDLMKITSLKKDIIDKIINSNFFKSKYKGGRTIGKKNVSK